jgi:hypothetical protein
MMNLKRDVLDLLILDPEGAPIGRVDGVIASDDGHGRLRLQYLEVGGTTLAGRFHPAIAPRLQRWARWLSPRHGRPCRIPWVEIERFGKAVHLKTGDAAQCTQAWAHWLKRHVLNRIPGA